MHPVPIPRSNEVKFRQRVWTMNIAGGLFKHNTTETYVGNAETAEQPGPKVSQRPMESLLVS